MKKLTIDDVEFIFEALPEDMPYVGNCSAIDAEADKATEQWIENELESGNEYAWFTAKVTARWNEFEGVQYLGACSYRSRDEFLDDAYFADMKFMAFDDLKNTILAAQKAVCGIEVAS